MPRKLFAALALVCLASPLSAQSLIFPKFFDQHVPHMLTKPAIAFGITEGLKLAGVPKTWAVVGGLALPLVFGKIRQEIGYPGSIGKTETWKDSIADTFAAATVLIPLNLKGSARWANKIKSCRSTSTNHEVRKDLGESTSREVFFVFIYELGLAIYIRL